MYNFLYFVGLCNLYAYLCHSIRNNDVIAVNDIWCLTWVLFASTNKVLYARLTLYVSHVLHHVHPSIRVALNHRMISLHGQSNHHIPPDMMTEKQNLVGR